MGEVQGSPCDLVSMKLCLAVLLYVFWFIPFDLTGLLLWRDAFTFESEG